MTSAIYVENGVGRAVVEALNLFTRSHGVAAHFQHDVHPQMQRRQYGDEWWIRDVAGRGMAILTQDCAILDNDDERDAVRSAGAKVIALGNGEYSVWSKLRCIAIHWNAIETLLAGGGAGAAIAHLSKYEVRDLSR